ncbi:NlpC/P60 family protein [Angustibacter sp. McL0619]|uniref:NlpC/P60 family protein n=1 Tax=Angustibacter sp. McL0619 TaxID=3415676 RepID=UPI003CED1FDE
MTAVSVLSRIEEIRSSIATLATAQPAAATGTDSGFAVQLAAATGDSTSQDSATLGSSSPAGPDGDDVVTDARKYLGVPYKWGGTDPQNGLDCSGLVQRVFDDLGVKLPRTVHEQKDSGQAVASMADAKPGDLLVFGDHHIGIYVGGGKMLHAPHTGTDVKIAKVYETPTRIRRVLPAGNSHAVASSPVGVARPSALRQAASGSTRYDALFAAATQRYDLPAGMLKAVAKAESGFDASARSGAGAIGLMQLMPGTARELGVDPSNPSQAVDGAARLLKKHLDAFGSVPLALAAYNAGPGAVKKYHGIPPYSETRIYVRRVTAAMEGAA